MMKLCMHQTTHQRTHQRMLQRARLAGAVLGAFAALAQAQAQAQTQSQSQSQEQTQAQAISSAETLLFETDHLARVQAPATLVYEFRKVSNVEPGFSDKVRLDLAKVRGKLNATLHFLSGEHKQEIPALEEVHGNPVLLGFLEHDINEMKRLTGGSTSYFRKRIRMALAQDAQVNVQSITYRGKALQAQVVRIQPYLHDPMHARFEKYLRKTYTFVLSEQVPGGLYELRTSLGNGAAVRTAEAAPTASPAASPAASTAAEAVIDETLTLTSVTPKQP
jgi:hypothetical protein